MDVKQSVRFISIALVAVFSISAFLHLFKLHYAWEVFANSRQFKTCIILAMGIQLSLVITGITGLISAPGLYFYKKWSRQLLCTALTINICAFLFKSIARFWPNLLCNYVKENMAPYMSAKEAFIYNGILYHPSPMTTMLTFLATVGLLYYFTRRSCVRLFIG